MMWSSGVNRWTQLRASLDVTDVNLKRLVEEGTLERGAMQTLYIGEYIVFESLVTAGYGE
jgi:hypothetical protein